MAFLTSITVRGRTYPQAYINVESVQTYKHNTFVTLRAWEDQATRQAELPPLQWELYIQEFPTTDLSALNPIAYAYTLLEQSGEFADATWNVV